MCVEGGGFVCVEGRGICVYVEGRGICVCRGEGDLCV